jgi:O-antigen ligase
MLSLFSLAGLIFFVPLFKGGTEETALGFSSVLILLAILGLFFGKGKSSVNDKQIVIWNIWPVLVLSIFILLAGIFAYNSLNSYNSFFDYIWWPVYLLIFVATLLARPLENIRVFSNVHIMIAVVLSLFGIISAFFGVTRIGSLFYLHSAFAGFLLIPLCFSFFYMFSCHGKLKIFYAINAVIIATAFALTLSRGGFLSISIAGIIAAGITLYKNKKGVGASMRVVALLTMLFIASLTIWLSLDHGRVFTWETKKINAISLRLEYWSDAVDMIREHPWTGVGIGNYDTVLRFGREKLGFYSSDPHNVFLKMYAETGIAAIFFAVFIFLVLKASSIQIVRGSIVTAGAIGLIAFIIQSTIDVVWMFPANVAAFMMWSAIVFSAQRKADVNIADRNVTRNQYYIQCNGKLKVAIASLSVIVAIASLSISFSHKYPAYAIIKNPEHLFDRAADIFNSSPNNLVEANVYIEEAIELAPRESKYYFLAGKIDMAIGNVERAKVMFGKSIEVNPAAGYKAIVILADIYLDEGKNNEAILLLRRHAPRFVAYTMSEAFANDIYADEVREFTSLMVFELGHAYKRTGKIEAAEKMFELGNDIRQKP